MKPFSIIVAVDNKLGIGKNGLLPWHLPSDLKYFKKITTQVYEQGKPNAVIMGRKTWESIPERLRPLPLRLNVVISRQSALSLPDGVILARSLQEALDSLSQNPCPAGGIFVIGGSQIFQQAVVHPACQKIYLTRVLGDFSCDTFFPDVLGNFTQSSDSALVIDQNVSIRFLEYIKKIH